MYRILIGLNIRLEAGEKWSEKAGKVIRYEGAPDEVRFEPGETVKNFPKGTDVKSLVEMEAVEPAEEELHG